MKLLFFKSPLYLFLSLAVCLILIYVAFQIGYLSETAEIGKGKKTLERLSVIMFIPCILLFIFLLVQVDLLYWKTLIKSLS